MKTDEITIPKRILVAFEKVPAGAKVYLNETDEIALFERSNSPLNETLWTGTQLWIDEIPVDKL